MAINMSLPGSYPALVIASSITSMASSFDFKFGANPPSSPTPVEYPFSFKVFFNEWYTSAQAWIAASNELKPAGITINSCKSTELSAWEPPFIMFIIGTGRTLAFTPPTYWYRGNPKKLAAALATAKETPRIAFAPNLPLLSVPSSSISFLSMAVWSNTLYPINSLAIISFTLATAVLTPLPIK